MKLAAFGDTHGRDTWKTFVKELDDADKIIFIGDYFDSITISFIEQLHNFKEILDFKRNDPDRVILLMGNHDLHYLPEFISIGEYYSGYQGTAWADIQSHLLPAINNHEIQMAYSYDKYLFTHAGVTNTWCKEWGIDTTRIEDHINELFYQNPRCFGFNGYDTYGDDITQGPCWVRPDSLRADRLKNYIHVVGHTKFKRVVDDFADMLGAIYIDCLDTSEEFLTLTI